jgi:hypothetical protein
MGATSAIECVRHRVDNGGLWAALLELSRRQLGASEWIRTSTPAGSPPARSGAAAAATGTDPMRSPLIAPGATGASPRAALSTAPGTRPPMRQCRSTFADPRARRRRRRALATCGRRALASISTSVPAGGPIRTRCRALTAATSGGQANAATSTTTTSATRRSTTSTSRWSARSAITSANALAPPAPSAHPTGVAS